MTTTELGGPRPDTAGAAPHPAPRALDRTHRGVTLGLLALVTMFAFEAVAISLALPRVAHALDGETLYPIAFIGMLTASLVGMVMGGAWGDARGALGPVVAGGVGFVVGLLVSGLAGSMEVLVVGRLLQGLGAGAALTGMYVAVADGYPQALRTRIFSLFATAWVLPSVVGPFVAGALVDLLGWRSVFLVVAGFALLSTLAVAAPLRRVLTRRHLRLQLGRRPLLAAVAAAGAVLLHLAGHGTALATTLLLLAGLALVALAVPHLLPRGTMRARPGLPRVVAARGVFGATFACAEMFLPLVLQDESGLTPTATGLVMMVGALGWTAGSAWSGRHADAADPASGPGLLRAGGAFLVAGALVLACLVPLEHLTWVAVGVATLGFAVMATGMGIATPLLSSLALDLAEPGRQGQAGSAVQVSDALAQSVAAGVVGAVFARWFLLDADSSYLAGFGVALALAVLALAVTRRPGANRAATAATPTEAAPTSSAGPIAPS